MSSPAHVHSLLHCNLNTADLALASAFYEDLLGLTAAMKTAREPVDGAGLGVDGTATSEVWFMYDGRGPRIAPALELMEWESPAGVGSHPADPHHLGLAAVGYAVPAMTPNLAAWPVGGSLVDVERIRDRDGVPVELVTAPVDAPVFSHLRLNCSDLSASTDWYARIGLAPRGEPTTARDFGVGLGLDASAELIATSLCPQRADTFSLELNQWRSPGPVGQPPPVPNHRGLYRIALGVEDLTAAHAALAEDAPDIPSPVWVAMPGTRLGGVPVLFLRDPDGVVVELVERPCPDLSKALR
jgi:catechol 2,3-dioxygenase-like lactoylglutathione lyase family enzyme